MPNSLSPYPRRSLASRARGRFRIHGVALTLLTLAAATPAAPVSLPTATPSVTATSHVASTFARTKNIHVDRLRGLIERIHPEELGENLRRLESRSDRIARWLDRADEEAEPFGLSPADIVEAHRRLVSDYGEADGELGKALERKRDVQSIFDDLERGHTVLVADDEEPAPRATREEMLRLLEAMIGLCDASDVIAHRMRAELARQGRALEGFEHER